MFLIKLNLLIVLFPSPRANVSASPKVTSIDQNQKVGITILCFFSSIFLKWRRARIVHSENKKKEAIYYVFLNNGGSTGRFWSAWLKSLKGRSRTLTEFTWRCARNEFRLKKQAKNCVSYQVVRGCDQGRTSYKLL